MKNLYIWEKWTRKTVKYEIQSVWNKYSKYFFSSFSVIGWFTILQKDSIGPNFFEAKKLDDRVTKKFFSVIYCLNFSYSKDIKKSGLFVSSLCICWTSVLRPNASSPLDGKSRLDCLASTLARSDSL